MYRLAVIAALVASCGDNETPLAATSGTRLVLREYTFDDGQRLIDREIVHDTARDEDCAPARWSDGLAYCTPSAGELVYADAQCLTPIARLPLDSTATYAADRVFDDEISHLYRVGVPYSPSSSEIWRLDHGACVGAFPSDPAAYLTLAGEEPRDAFARITTDVRGDGRLRTVTLRSDDGLVLPARLHDRMLGLDCAPASAPDAATTTCAPTDARVATYFADAACTRPVVDVAAGTSSVSIAIDRAGCRSYASFGSEVPSAPLWAGDACAMLQGSSTHRYIAAGPPLDLAEVPRRVEPADTRIWLIDVAGLTDSLVHDAELDLDCQPTPVGGMLRCLPAVANAEVETRFTDVTCTERIDVVNVPAVTCVAQPRFVVDSSNTYRRLELRVTTSVYALSGTGCVPSQNADSLWTIGPPFDPAHFAAVSVHP